MKTRLSAAALFLVTAAFGLSVACSKPDAVEAVNLEDSAPVVKGNNDFAFELYSALSAEKGNLFLSPYSISSALAMTFAGARGETAKQMEAALHFGPAGARLNAGFLALMTKLNAPGQGYQLSVANALWGQRGFKFLREFIRTVKAYYGGGFEEVDYAGDTERARATINAWVEARTERKIIELIKPRVLTSLTRLVLTNAIYFKGQWAKQFKPEDTREEPFYVSADDMANVPMMSQGGKFLYGETDSWQVLELPYSGGGLVMDVLLPKPGADLPALESGLKSADFESLTGVLAPRSVEVFLPRFKSEKKFLLNETLAKMGMPDAFDMNKADFSGMSEDFLYITHVIHKAFVDVNEEGTEAAAATAVVMDTKSTVVETPAVFRADRPFLFLIRDTQSGSILFMGRLSDPR